MPSDITVPMSSSVPTPNQDALQRHAPLLYDRVYLLCELAKGNPLLEAITGEIQWVMHQIDPDNNPNPEG